MKYPSFPLKSSTDNPSRRCSVFIPSSGSYLDKLQYQRGIVTRCSYEYDDCISKGGIAYFVTFTFNDNALITLTDANGNKCNFASNSSFRLLMINHVNNRLKRDYDCSVKYLCTSELGEAKGSRGLYNNPHFHVIYFISPLHKSSSVPSPSEFESLLREYWCGPQFSLKKGDPSKYRYGILSYSDQGAVVKSHSAIVYVAKYVTKDSVYKFKFNQLKSCIRNLLISDLQSYISHQNYLVNSALAFHDSNLPGLADFVSSTSSCLDPRSFSSFLKSTRNKLLSLREFTSFIQHITSVIRSRCLTVSSPLLDVWSHQICTFLAKYLLPKTRISNNLGLSALNDIKDLSHPTLPYRTVKGVRQFNLPTYYYRKLFYDVETLKTPEGYKVRYKPNKLYIDIHCDFVLYSSSVLKSANDLYSKVTANQFSIYSLTFDTEFHSSQVLHLSEISLDNCIDYVIFNKVYRGRVNQICSRTFSDSFSDYCSNLYNDHYSSLLPYSRPYLDDCSLNGDFEHLSKQFLTLDLLIYKLFYAKDLQLAQNADEFRKIRRDNFVTVSSDKPCYLSDAP